WSSPFPCGIPSAMSTRTTSRASSLLASPCATVAPTCPAPTTVILFAMVPFDSTVRKSCRFSGHYFSFWPRGKVRADGGRVNAPGRGGAGDAIADRAALRRAMVEKMAATVGYRGIYIRVLVAERYISFNGRARGAT